MNCVVSIIISYGPMTEIDDCYINISPYMWMQDNAMKLSNDMLNTMMTQHTIDMTLNQYIMMKQYKAHACNKLHITSCIWLVQVSSHICMSFMHILMLG